MTGRSPDVVVIGGGIVGTATAAFLAAAGADVLLVEAEAVAAGASGRNSGVVQHPLDATLAGLHRETIALYRALETESDGAFFLGSEPAGLLYVSLDADVPARLAAELASTHPELSPALVTGRQLESLEPSLAPGVAACRLAIGFPVAPASATRAYAALAERLGARIQAGAAARLVGRDGRATGVSIGSDVVAAGAVVVAAGPWTPAIIDPATRWVPIRSVWGAVVEVMLEAPPRHVLEEAEIDVAIEPSAGDRSAAAEPDLPRTGHAVSFSLVTAAGRSVVGSTFLDSEPDPAALAAAIVARGATFVPAIATARIASHRRCARPQSFDGRPLVGPVPGIENLFVAAGHGPWGISTGPATARFVADLVLRRPTAVPAALSPDRFPPPPALRGAGG